MLFAGRGYVFTLMAYHRLRASGATAVEQARHEEVD